MGKRGQITLFIVMGILILSALGFLFLARSYSEESPESLPKLSLDAESIKEYRNFCLEKKIMEGIDYFGVMPGAASNIENYIEHKLEECANFEEYIAEGVDVMAGEVDARVIITQEAVLVNVNYPITIRTKDEELSFSSFNYYMPREKQTTLNLNQNKETQTSINIVSEDRDAEITIPTGTRITDENGNPISEISLRVLERNFDDLSNDVVIGMVVYEGLPDGAIFDPPISLTINYNEDELPPGIKEEDLKIAWFDKDRGLWWGLPTTVDTVNNALSAQVSHFTPFAATVCSPENVEGILENANVPDSDETTDAGIFRSDIVKIENVVEDKVDYYVYLLTFLPLFEQTCGRSYTEDGDCLPPPTLWELNNEEGWHEQQLVPTGGTSYPNLKSGLNPPLEQTMVTYGECVEDEKQRDWDLDDQETEPSCTLRWSQEVNQDCNEKCTQVANNLYAGLEEFKSGDGLKDEGCTCNAVYDSVNNVFEIENCNLESIATAATYGYDGDKTAPGGWAVIPFNVGSGNGGDACIRVDGYGEPEIHLKLVCSDSDVCGDQAGEEDQETIKDYLFDVTGYTQFTKDFEHDNIKFNPENPPEQDDPQADITGEETGIIDGPNNLYIKIENTDDDGCVWAEAQLKIRGIGITWDLAYCTVQDVINNICGYTDGGKDGAFPDCPVGFGGKHPKVGNLLRELINNAGANHDPPIPQDKLGTDPGWRGLSINQLDPDLYEKVNAWCTGGKGGGAAPGNDCNVLGGECIEACDEETQTPKQWHCDEGVCCEPPLGEQPEGEKCEGEGKKNKVCISDGHVYIHNTECGGHWQITQSNPAGCAINCGGWHRPSDGGPMCPEFCSDVKSVTVLLQAWGDCPQEYTTVTLE